MRVTTAPLFWDKAEQAFLEGPQTIAGDTSAASAVATVYIMTAALVLATVTTVAVTVAMSLAITLSFSLAPTETASTSTVPTTAASSSLVLATPCYINYRQEEYLGEDWLGPMFQHPDTA